VAKTNHLFLKNFFKDQFPEYARNELYITGESYAGIYVPTIVREILKDPGNMNLKGFAVGDGCIGFNVLCGPSKEYNGPYWQLEFYHGHGQISNELYNSITNNCPEKNLKNGNLTPYCQKLYREAVNEIGGAYPYNLYDDCTDNIFLQYKKIINIGDLLLYFYLIISPYNMIWNMILLTPHFLAQDILVRDKR